MTFPDRIGPRGGDQGGSTVPDWLAGLVDAVADRVAARIVGHHPQPDPEPIGRVLTPEAVARVLRVPLPHVYRHARALGGVKIGKYWRFPKAALRQRLARS